MIDFLTSIFFYSLARCNKLGVKHVISTIINLNNNKNVFMLTNKRIISGKRTFNIDPKALPNSTVGNNMREIS